MSTRLCAVSDLVEGTALRVELDDIDLAVIRLADEIFVIEDRCSHAEVPLSDGEITGCTIECELHGSRFDLRSGQPTGPPATRPIAVYPNSIVNGDVVAEIDLDHPNR
jgi:3-phenylpropionate/trans-cinnamate dioxygenase ferredoxin subunit